MARKGDGIYLRGKTWWMDVRVHGKRYQKALGKNIKRAVAVEFASLERAKILRGEAGIGQKKRQDMPFEKAADEFLAWVKANKRANTHTSYQQCLAQLKTSFVGKTLGEIHPFLIEKHKQRRLSEGVKVSVNREITCLKTLFYRMIDWKKFEGENPARKVKKLEESQGRLRYLSTDEEERLLAAAKEPLRTIILVGIYTGLRVTAEALTLRWENIDLVKGLLTVESAYAKGKETSTLPLSRKLVDALKAIGGRGEREFIFVSRNGTPFRSIRTAFDTACRRAKLSDVTPHTLRHTFASKLAEKRVGDRTLQALGRWKEPKMIQRYAHLSEEHLREAIEKIASDSPTEFTTAETGSAAKSFVRP